MENTAQEQELYQEPRNDPHLHLVVLYIVTLAVGVAAAFAF